MKQSALNMSYSGKSMVKGDSFESPFLQDIFYHLMRPGISLDFVTVSKKM